MGVFFMRRIILREAILAQAVPALLELLRTSTSLETILLEPPNPLLRVGRRGVSGEMSSCV